jgi:hypothetical protein
VAGRYLIIDMSGDVPQLVSSDDVLPEALRLILSDIRDQLGVIVSQGSAEQAQLDTLAAGINAVAAHVTSAAGTLQQFIADAQAAQAANQPLDFTGANQALASLTSADSTLQGIVPQAPEAPLPDPVPDPGPPLTPDQVPSDPAPDIGTGTDTGAPPPDATGDVPPT